MQISFFEIVLLLGVIQGIILSVILFTLKSNQPANRFLGTAMFFLSVEIFYLFISRTGLLDYIFYLIPVLFSLPFIHVPFLFIYVKELTTEKSNEKQKLLHFIPLMLCLLFISGLYIWNDSDAAELLKNIHNDNLLFTHVVNNLKPVYAVVYVFSMLIYIRRHNRKLKDSFSNLDKVNLKWLRNFTIGIIVITTILVIQNISEFIYNETSVLQIYLFISIVFLIYLIGYYGLKQPEIFNQNTLGKTAKQNENNIKYRKSGLTDITANEYLNKLLRYMETEKPYLKGSLTLQELADNCGISIHHLSEIINSRLNQNFYDFVNKYRVEEFIKRLENEENVKYTILALAYDCGFNSKSSFNSIFKKFTNKTPSEYRKLL